MPLTNLNPEQLSAATAPFGKNLIIASAGTGKTSTIIGRIAHLLNSGKKPEEILLLTFTNKAAGEMVARLAGSFGKSVASKVVAGTFHSVSYKWLKEIGENITLKQPSELKILFKTIYDKYAHALSVGDGSLLTHAALYDYYSLWENRSDDDFAKWIEGKNPAHSTYASKYEMMFEEFDALKSELGFVGFNDLLINMKKRLSGGIEVPFFEVLVDEYQDTNPLQNSLLEHIDSPSLFCVGDYDQSIYAFNGAEIGIISTFDQRYRDAKVFSLSKNYRSTRLILDLANTVISHNQRVYPKKLEVIKTSPDQPPKLLAYNELYEQYQDIARKIAMSPYPKENIAVIFRNNSSADGIEAMLRELSIPCRRKGGNSFFDSREIKAILDLITLSVNPKDLLAFIHIMEFGSQIGAARAKELYDQAMAVGSGNLIRGWQNPDKSKKLAKKSVQLDLFAEPSSSVLPDELADHPLFEVSLPSDATRFLVDFWQLVPYLNANTLPQSLIATVTNSPFFARIAERLAKSRAMNKNKTLDQARYEEAKERIFTKATTLRELSKHYDSVERFINAMVLGGNEMSEGSGVNLLSVHASKGLEFDEVFVIDLADGRFPNRKLMKQAGEIEEERRLFYVAVTRAKESLYLSYAGYDKYKKIDYKPSIFLYEAKMITKA